MMNAVYEKHAGRVYVRLDAGETAFTVYSGGDILFRAPKETVKAAYPTPEKPYITLTFKDRPEEKLYIIAQDDMETVRLILKGCPDIAGDYAPSFRLIMLCCGIAAVTVLLIVSLYFNIAATALSRIVPYTWETKVADIALERMRSSGSCRNREAKTALSRVVSPLVKAAAITAYPPVRIIPVEARGDEPALFSIPGAVTVVNDLYIKEAPDGDRLAAAFARELLYIKARKPLRDFIVKAGTFGAASALLPFLQGTEAAAMAGGRFLRSENDIAGQAVSDIAVAKLMLKAGLRADGAVKALQAEYDASVWPSPSLKKRINALEHFLKTDSRYAPLQRKYAAVPPLKQEELQKAARICAMSRAR